MNFHSSKIQNFLQYFRVLTIAGSDSGGGAGIQADIKTISAMGCYATSAITAITVQNTLGVQSVFPVTNEILAGQIEAVLSSLSIDTATVIQNQDFNTEPKAVNLKALLYEADEDGYNFPWYVESYYYDGSKQWMIYTSHEFTITFAGEKLVCAAKEIIDSKYLIQ